MKKIAAEGVKLRAELRPEEEGEEEVGDGGGCVVACSTPIQFMENRASHAAVCSLNTMVHARQIALCSDGPSDTRGIEASCSVPIADTHGETVVVVVVLVIVVVLTLIQGKKSRVRDHRTRSNTSVLEWTATSRETDMTETLHTLYGTPT